ncbi:MAG: ATP-binding protein [Lachnospiraceae bacterium]|nr:ATP-binding protein [Lachnospiraceae bacterium]
MMNSSEITKESQNPFTLSFGKIPSLYISRLFQTEEIVRDFRQAVPSSQVYMITGVRGSGKTVFMSGISKEFEQESDWLVIELNPNRDLLQSLAAALYALPGMAALFIKAKLDFSFLGFGATIEGGNPIFDIESALARMLEVIQNAGKRVLICIDEASNTEHMRIFASSFQMLIRQDYPICLLMTGLYENIYDLQNEKNLTFLYRAPKVRLEPLNFTAVRANYEKTLRVSREEAGQLASIVKGYPYAFQLLGYLYWTNAPATADEILPLFDQYLDEYVYSKIWSELSGKDKFVLNAMAESEAENVKDLRESLRMTSNEFSVYRDRLLRKGVIGAPERGRVVFLLPRFREFVTTKEV